MTDRDVEDLGLTAGGPAPAPEPSPGIWVYASVALPHLGRGDHAYVNPNDPAVAEALAATWLVPFPGQDWQRLLIDHD